MTHILTHIAHPLTYTWKMPCVRVVLLAGPSVALQQACESAGQTESQDLQKKNKTVQREVTEEVWLLLSSKQIVSQN